MTLNTCVCFNSSHLLSFIPVWVILGALHNFLYFKDHFITFLKFLLFICAYNVWVISAPFPLTPLHIKYNVIYGSSLSHYRFSSVWLLTNLRFLIFSNIFVQLEKFKQVASIHSFYLMLYMLFNEYVILSSILELVILVLFLLIFCDPENFNELISMCVLEDLFWSLFPFFVCGTGVWTQGLALARQVLCYLSQAPNLPFCLNNVWVWPCAICQSYL
jgi:hypothetical protein